MSRLRYGIAGGGFVTAFHLEALRHVRGIEVAGLVSKNPLDELVAFVHKHALGEGRVFASIQQMVPEVDVVAVFVPNFVRLEVMQQIVDAVQVGAQTLSGKVEKTGGWETYKCAKIAKGEAARIAVGWAALWGTTVQRAGEASRYVLGQGRLGSLGRPPRGSGWAKRSVEQTVARRRCRTNRC